MASLTEPQVAPASAREGFDTRNKDLNVACDDTQELRSEDDKWEDADYECTCCGWEGTGWLLHGKSVCMDCYDYNARVLDDLEREKGELAPSEAEEDEEEEYEHDYAAEERGWYPEND